ARRPRLPAGAGRRPPRCRGGLRRRRPPRHARRRARPPGPPGRRRASRRMSAAVLWSGGKDCFAAALRAGALERGGTRPGPFGPAGERVAFRCHPLGVMRRQAAALGLRHELVEISRARWETSYRDALVGLAAEGIEEVVSGDIMPEQWPWLA